MKISMPRGTNLLFHSILSILFLCINHSAYSQDEEYRDEDIEDSLELTLEDIEYQMFADSIEATMVFEVGTIELGQGIAILVVPEGYKYLDVEQSEYVLNELWGNPPSPSLGMLFEEESNVLSNVGYVIDITYNEMGYIDDEDAADIDYDELEEEMFGDNDEDNRMRVEAGYETIDFIGWASEPYYDATAKKLHWAQELSFGGSDEHTLNYAIRILGRKGVLQMNFISDMTELNNVKADIPLIMPSVNFTEGNQYADFDPDIDTLAAVGIGGLIAGKVLAKGGILIFLAKIWKFLAIGAVAAVAFFRKRFGAQKDEVTEKLPAKIEDTEI